MTRAIAGTGKDVAHLHGCAPLTGGAARNSDHGVRVVAGDAGVHVRPGVCGGDDSCVHEPGAHGNAQPASGGARGGSASHVHVPDSFAGVPRMRP